MSRTAFVTTLYAGLLGRSPDPQGLADWVGALKSSHLDRHGVILGFLNSIEFNNDCQSKYGFSGGAGAFSNLGYGF